jgi:Secretion system C-terminal sorting domain/Pectate lyase superfamily protein
MFCKTITQFFGLSLLLSTHLSAQTIPANRTVDWSLAGYRGVLPTWTLNYNIQNAGLVGDGITPNDAALQSVLTNVAGTPTILDFPAGNYRFNSTINLPANILIKGRGADSTTFSFYLNGTGDAIAVYGSIAPTDSTYFTAPANKGDISVQVNNPSRYVAGEYVRIMQNDSSYMFSTWAYKTLGQILKVDSVVGNRVYFASPLRRGYELARTPYLVGMSPKQNVGIECLRIKRMDASAGQTTNIEFLYAANCWVKNIQSDSCNFAHIQISSSTNVEIKHSYFHHAHAYGGGGQGYGVEVDACTGECLVEDNIFSHLRHSILIQSGANGNVFGYNFSRDPFWSQPFPFPSNSAGDIALHGNYPYANLLEGNIVANIVVDNSHDANGEDNTFFRNRTTLFGVVFSNATSPNQVFVANEITNVGGIYGMYSLQGTGHFEYGNNRGGTLTPANATVPEQSLYRTSQPAFLSDCLYAGIGVGSPFNTNQIPAKERWDYQEINRGACGQPLNNRLGFGTTDTLTVSESAGQITIPYRVRNGSEVFAQATIQPSATSTATNSTDFNYILADFNLNFDPILQCEGTVSLNINDDANNEPTEFIRLSLGSNHTNTLIGADSVLIIKILDNDAPPVGVAELESNTFEAFPNPNQGILNLRSRQPLETVSLFNSLGQLVFQAQNIGQNTLQIQLPVLPAGVYLLQATDGHSQQSKQIILQP